MFFRFFIFNISALSMPLSRIESFKMVKNLKIKIIKIKLKIIEIKVKNYKTNKNKNKNI